MRPNNEKEPRDRGTLASEKAQLVVISQGNLKRYEISVSMKHCFRGHSFAKNFATPEVLNLKPDSSPRN